MFQNLGSKINFSKLFLPFFGVIVSFLTLSNLAHATTGIDEIAGNIVETSAALPGLVTGMAYLLGLVFAVYGVIKSKEHVENPNQTALRYPVISLAIGGALFALPMVYEAMDNLIQPGEGTVDFDPGGNAVTIFGDLMGSVLGLLPLQVFGQVLSNIVKSIDQVPGFITAIAYLLGLVMGFAGLLKLKEHVEEPTRTMLKAGVIRLIVGGMLFAIPTVYAAIYNAVSEDGEILDAAALVVMTLTSGGITTEGGTCLTRLGDNTIGGVACKLFASTTPMVAFLSAIAYLFGLIVGLWGILQIKEHVENPEQVKIWDPVAKLFVAGGFFALPNIVTVAYNTVGALIAPHSNSRGGEVRNVGEEGGGPEGLDAMLGALMNDAFIPITVLVNWFCLGAGFILIFIGISRLMKSAQEGARGPGGIGTIMTFITGGALAAFSPMISSLSASLFTDELSLSATGIQTGNEGTFQYTAGLDIARAETVLDAIILFVALLGIISIARGIFIMRGVAEGSSQASAMAGVTHLIGGALAVNLGPMLNAVQVTLGIFDLNLGIRFG